MENKKIFIKDKEKLEELKNRYLQAGVTGYWINLLDACINDGLYFDHVEYNAVSPELQKCWEGLY